MSKPSVRRFGALMVVVLLLSAVLVPAAAAAPQANVSQGGYSCPIYHRVVKGDTLTRIAYRYGVSISQLMQWNGIWNPDRIYVGQVLKINRWCNTPPPHPRPGPKPGPKPGPGSFPWIGTYYNSRDLSGGIALQRAEGRPCYNWGWGSPGPQVMPDNFSARWTTTSNALGGTYRINVKTDDGARVWVDGRLVLDEWREQAVRGFFVDTWLSPGWHTWTVEYFEQTGVAEFCFSAQKIG